MQVDCSDAGTVLAALRELAVTQYGGKGVPPVAAASDGAANAAEHGTASVAHGGGGGGSGARIDGHCADGFSDVLRVEAILSTHRHWDHTAGNAQLIASVASCRKVYGGRADGVPCCTHPVDDGAVIKVGEYGLAVEVVATPCHTRGSVCFKLRGAGGRRSAIFTGDTLFCGGCGAPFEGDAKAMHAAFARIWLEVSRRGRLVRGVGVYGWRTLWRA